MWVCKTLVLCGQKQIYKQIYIFTNKIQKTIYFFLRTLVFVGASPLMNRVPNSARARFAVLLFQTAFCLISLEIQLLGVDPAVRAQFFLP